jgi:hypothetical protein
MNELNQVSNFLEYYDVFLELASIYSNRIQIALKPHPCVKRNKIPMGVEKLQHITVHGIFLGTVSENGIILIDRMH